MAKFDVKNYVVNSDYIHLKALKKDISLTGVLTKKELNTVAEEYGYDLEKEYTYSEEHKSYIIGIDFFKQLLLVHFNNRNALRLFKLLSRLEV